MGREGGEIPERDAHVSRLRHRIDEEGDEQVTRDEYDECVECESVGELNIETRRRMFLLSKARKVQR